MEIARLLFEITVFRPNACCIFPFLFSNLVATVLVSIFCSGNAMFFVKENLLDLCIASDKELSITPLEETPINHSKHTIRSKISTKIRQKIADSRQPKMTNK